MMSISIPKIETDVEIKKIFPGLMLGCLVSPVKVMDSPKNLVDKMAAEIGILSDELDAAGIREMSAVKSMKQTYKQLGKDPNRYRPAAESLLRRVSKGKGLYHVNNVVDSLNLASVKSGFSICGYDMDRIQGEISLGKGKTEEPYEGIGRGVLNIENLPVFRDSAGAFGTPTSDSGRTMIDASTKKVFMILPSFDGDKDKLEDALDLLSNLLITHVEGASPETKIIFG